MSRRSQERPKAPGAASVSVRRWEYLQVAVRGETWSDSSGRAGRLPIDAAGPGQVPRVVGVLHELGAKGGSWPA